MSDDLDPAGGSSSRNYFIKITVLVLLCGQNSGHALLSRYSQAILKESYSTTEVVIMAELLKMLISAFLIFREEKLTLESEHIKMRFSKLTWLIMNSNRIIVVVILYAINNILAYYALARVEASVYTVTQQLKILTTACLAVYLYGKVLANAQWRALLLLLIGCTLVVSPTFNNIACDYDSEDKRSLIASNNANDLQYSSTIMFQDIFTSILPFNSVFSSFGSINYGDKRRLVGVAQEHNVSDSIAGVTAILVMVSIAGYASVYLENTVKDKSQNLSIWERNFQIAFYSVLLLLGAILWNIFYSKCIAEHSPEEIETFGETDMSYVPFRGWTSNTVILLLLQTAGGLLVAATLKYADSILKTLATSGAIVLTTFFGFLLLDGTLDVVVVLGCVCTILGIVNYSFQ